MSITTLKRKSAARYGTASVGQPQFSLAGMHRSQGYIGQTNFGRSYAVNTQIDLPKTTKQSSFTNSGLIATKYRWIKRGYPFTTVKSDSNHNANTASARTDSIRREVIAAATNDVTKLMVCPTTGEHIEYDLYVPQISHQEYLQRYAACLTNPVQTPYGGCRMPHI